MFHHLSCDSYSETGGRRENEDSAGIRFHGEMLTAVAADGLGGHGDGKAASDLVCSLLLETGADGNLPDRAALEAAFRRANGELLARQENAYHMKSTAVLLCLRDDRAVWAHIGDTRLYHVHDGRLVHYTLDHSSSQMAVFLGEISREEIPADPRRNLLLRAMGVEGDEPEMHDPILLEPGRHAFVLCSDGLWGYLTDDEITDACTRAESAEDCLAELRRLHDSRGGRDGDNHTGVVILLEIKEAAA